VSDPVREYTEAEDRRLYENLVRINDEIHRGALSGRPLTLALLRDLHAALFGGVRSHAGRCRGPGFGQERLSFGPNRSVHRNDVGAELDRVFEKAAVSLRSFEANPDHPQYEELAFRLAVWVHAELVRIHPFEDGNGRTSRALMNCILVRLGLRPVALEAPRQEYHEALNHYYPTEDLEPLLDLALRLYAEALQSI